MAYKNVKKEHLEHDDIIDLLKKHFSKDEDDMHEMDDDMVEEGKEIGELERHNDHEESESPEEEEEEREEKVPKDKRKRIAIAVLSKRLSKPKIKD